MRIRYCFKPRAGSTYFRRFIVSCCPSSWSERMQVGARVGSRAGEPSYNKVLLFLYDHIQAQTGGFSDNRTRSKETVCAHQPMSEWIATAWAAMLQGQPRLPQIDFRGVSGQRWTSAGEGSATDKAVISAGVRDIVYDWKESCCDRAEPFHRTALSIPSAAVAGMTAQLSCFVSESHEKQQRKSRSKIGPGP